MLAAWRKPSGFSGMAQAVRFRRPSKPWETARLAPYRYFFWKPDGSRRTANIFTNAGYAAFCFRAAGDADWAAIFSISKRLWTKNSSSS